jgi:hypothetical protein
MANENVHHNQHEHEDEKTYLMRILAEYRQKLEPYFAYIPWFMERDGKNLNKLYESDNDISGTIAVPVYDSTLLGFVKSMNESGLMNRNYPYVYSKYNLHSYADELAQIDKCELRDIDVILGIISRYVLGGMARGRMWTEAVEMGIFYHALVKIKEILSRWEDKTKNS